MHKKRKHLGVRTHICHYCGKGFFDSFNLKTHMDKGHSNNEKQYICDKCGSAYNSHISLKGHIREKHPVYYLCTFCEEMFQSSRKLRIHLYNSHEVKCGTKDYYLCWKCQKPFTSSKELDDHLCVEHEMSRLEHHCQLCTDKSYSSKVTLKMHVVETHDLDFTKVSNSPFITSLFNVIKEPNINTVPSAGVQCPVCQRMFSSNRSLADHRRQVHEKANHIKCQHCPFTAFQPYLMKRHVLRQHTKTTKYECHQCEYFTYDIGSINVHKRRVHNKVKSFQCAGCDKRFEKKRDYASHMLKTHNIVYQYNS